MTLAAFDTPLTRLGFLGIAGAAGLGKALGCSSGNIGGRERKKGRREFSR